MLRWEDSAGTISNTSIILAAQQYYLTIIRRDATNYHFTVRDLETGVEQTETTLNDGYTTGSSSYSLAWSDASTGMIGQIWSHTVLLPTISETTINTVKTFMLEKYTGVAGSAEVTADVFRLQDNQSNKDSTRSGRNFDLTFRAEDVAFIPDDFVVHLEVKH